MVSCGYELTRCFFLTYIDVNVSAVKAMNLNLATVNQLEVVRKWAKDF